MFLSNPKCSLYFSLISVMSICPKTKNNKTTTNLQTTSSTNKKTKDERTYTTSNAGTKVPTKKTYYEGKRGGADFFVNRQGGNKGNWRGQQNSAAQRKSAKYERYASGSSYLKPDGNLKETTKKVSLNHLLNFKFEPRNRNDSLTYSRPRYNNKVTRKQGPSAAFSKERFLQANCQFIVKKGGDYTVYNVDPDILVPWDKIEQIRVKSENEWSCPICLYPPSVAKITKCGHIYCWPCILHYLALEDKAKGCRGCPICHVDIKKDDLRSVIIELEDEIVVGSEITMKLMVRRPHFLVATPIGQADVVSTDSCERKITEYSSVQVLDLVAEPELESLKFKLDEDLDDLEKEFINAAITECEERKAQLISEISENCAASIEQDEAEKSTDTESADDNKSSSSSEEKKAYYFYQGVEGGNVYLNSLNMKCLLKEYDGYTNCPATVSAKVINVEYYVMSEDLRKRYKHLSHLPLSCEYKVVEVDLQPPLVSAATLSEFKEGIDRRANIRQKKEIEENNSKRRSEAQEQRRMKDFYRSGYSAIGSAVSGSYNSGTISVFVTEETRIAQPNFQNFPSENTTPSSEYSVSPRDHHDSATRSFAEMLKSGEVAMAKPIARRPQTTSTPTEVNNNTSKSDDDGDIEDPFYVPPTYKSSFGDALSSALDAIDATAKNTVGKSENEALKPSKRKQKRKKNKQTLLFSTSAQLHHL